MPSNESYKIFQGKISNEKYSFKEKRKYCTDSSHLMYTSLTYFSQLWIHSKWCYLKCSWNRDATKRKSENVEMVNGNKTSSNSSGRTFVPAINSKKPISNRSKRESENTQTEVNVQENQLHRGSECHNSSTPNYDNKVEKV